MAETMDDVEYQVSVTVRRADSGEKCVDEAVAALCAGVRETGSLMAATKRRGMSYSCAWLAVKRAEEALGAPLMEKKSGTGSVLTPFGERIVDSYGALVGAAAKSARRMLAATDRTSDGREP